MRYKAIFKDESKYSLFDDAYFTDKRVFWVSHQANLIGFSVAVCRKGRPVQVLDTTNQKEIIFEDAAAFDDWYLKNQSRDLDFGFSHLTKEAEIVTEAKRRINQLLDFLQTELATLQKQPFNSWRIDGGYKALEKGLKLANCSMEMIASKNTQLEDSLVFQKLKRIFNSPLAIKVEGCDIISFSKLPADKLDPSKLMDFCKVNIKQIIELNK